MHRIDLLSQNCPELHPCIRTYGCRFRCLQAIAEIETHKALKPQQILAIYTTLCADSTIMNKNCLCGPQEHFIITETLHALRCHNKKARQIGMMRNNVPLDWQGQVCAFNYMILHWRTQNAEGHYTLADKNGCEIFDPWDHGQQALDKIMIQRKLLYKIWTVEK